MRIIEAAVRRYRAPAMLAVVTAVSLLAMNVRLNAAYPPGDGGLFLQIINTILTSDFRFPDSIDYNGFRIPFAYSPGAFYSCALLVRIFGIGVAHAMNAWVAAWIVVLGWAGYWTARRFGFSFGASIVAAVALVTLPQGNEWLGFGGGATRAPGLVLYVLTVGACWHALGTQHRRDAVAAGLWAGTIALFHMEYAFLAAVTFVVLSWYRRPSVRTAATVGASAFLVTMPWLWILLHHPNATLLALQTASLDRGIGNAVSLLTFLGLNPTALSFAGNAGIIALVALVVAWARGKTLWAVWVLAAFAVDQRAAYHVAHVAVALALASAADAIFAMPRRGIATAGLLCTLLGFFCASTVQSTTAFRMTDGIAADVRAIARALPERSAVLVLPSIPSGTIDPFAADQTLEWFPVFAPQRSLLTYDGMEWVDKKLFSRTWRGDAKLAKECIGKAEGTPCILAVLRDADPGKTPLYVYAPKTPSGELIGDALRSDAHFQQVLSRATADVFVVRGTAVARL